MTHKYITLGIAFCALGLWIAYASYSLVDSIQWNQTWSEASWVNQNIRTINTGDLKFFNQWEDENLLWDFFDGVYYDSVYGIFNMWFVPNNRVKIKQSIGTCIDGRKKYTLSGLAYNENFGVVNFSNQAGKSEIYVCVDDNTSSSDYGQARFEGYVFSPYIGIQDFTGITFEALTNVEEVVEDDDGVLWRYTKVDGVASSSNDNLGEEFDNEVRVLWKIEKASLRKNISKRVYPLLKNATIKNGTRIVTSLDKTTWKNALNGTKLQNNTVLYFWNLQGSNVSISGNSLGNKTLIVEWGNLHITGNIRWSGILGIIVLKSQRDNLTQWNVYIDPAVTDIHASIYAEGSIISYKNNTELSGITPPVELANQLFIQWSVFTENTLWGGIQAPYSCPYFINNADCNADIARKYDLNYLRKYRLVEHFADDGTSLGKTPDYGWAQAFMWDNDRTNNTEAYKKFPLIIRYDSRIQQTPPPLF